MMMINIVGLAVIALIIWWFWLYKPEQTITDSNEVLIEVKNGVYSPAAIQVNANQSVTLKFLRKDESPCSEILLIPTLDISEQLKLNGVTQIHLSSIPQGEHVFHCQMQMYRGVLTVVKEES
ncbi:MULTISPECIES: cupredoxin domain-containing protein [Alteromonas/Salinimonas group]|uniref:Cupredoxin domain-containing protein n=2 Tax=Salinimonas TaxID=288793 RepID=A0A5B7YI85_9ALTE|nr:MULTISPECIES: cupredoxin domain-containing protein [Alteromonas/Salinimonas group]MBD3587163.1 cupredoxin domain-containing protein [Salinimonas profundi]QCZ95367.1 cupredoxin domain-containing protein [Salinimonas iocasae]